MNERVRRRSQQMQTLVFTFFLSNKQSLLKLIKKNSKQCFDASSTNFLQVFKGTELAIAFLIVVTEIFLTKNVQPLNDFFFSRRYKQYQCQFYHSANRICHKLSDGRH